MLYNIAFHGRKEKQKQRKQKINASFGFTIDCYVYFSAMAHFYLATNERACIDRAGTACFSVILREYWNNKCLLRSSLNPMQQQIFFLLAKVGVVRRPFKVN
jgi:hypothetical protein